MPFLPTLRRAVAAAASSESKVVAPLALSQYYSHRAEHALRYGTRDWPVERAVTEGYDRVIWVFKSIETIAADCARLPYRLREGDPLEGNIIEDHPMYRLLNKKANPLESGKVFRKRLSAQALLSKRGVFVEITKSNGGTPIRLDLLPPDRTEIIPDSSGAVDHYQLTRVNGTIKNIEPDRVRWFRNPHPIDPYMGTTAMEPGGMSIELDHFARVYNVAFMQNDGRPGGILAVKDTKGGTDIDPKYMDRIENRFGKGPVEAGKLSVIAGELDYVDLAARPRDMQYGSTSRNSKIEILSAFGVSETVLGYAAERTFSNADAELYNYWTRTIPAHAEILIDGFDEDSGDDLYGFLDTSGVEILDRTAKEKREEWRTEVAAGLRSIKSYADAAGYGEQIESTPHTRALYVPSGKTPLPSTEEDAEALGLAIPEEEPALPAGGGAPPALGPGPDAGPPAPGSGPGGGLTPQGGAAANGTPALGPSAPESPGGAPANRGAAAAALAAVAGKSAPALVAIEGGRPKVVLALKASATSEQPGSERTSIASESEARTFEDEVAAILTALTERWTERTLARLVGHKSRKGTRHWVPEYDEDTRVGTKALDAPRAVDAETWRAEAEETVSGPVRAAVAAASAALIADFAATYMPGAPSPALVADLVAVIVKMVGEAAVRQAERLTDDLNKADQFDVADMDSITFMIRERGEELARWSEAVATGVSMAAVNGGRDLAARTMSAAGADIDKEWYSRRDDRVRESHRIADGQRRRLDEPFIVGSSLMRFPQDPLAPIHETARCRCRVKHRLRSTGQFVTMGKDLARDADGDGFIYDGTPRQRPAPVSVPSVPAPPVAGRRRGVERPLSDFADAELTEEETVIRSWFPEATSTEQRAIHQRLKELNAEWRRRKEEQFAAARVVAPKPQDPAPGTRAGGFRPDPLSPATDSMMLWEKVLRKNTRERLTDDHGNTVLVQGDFTPEQIDAVMERLRVVLDQAPLTRPLKFVIPAPGTDQTFRRSPSAGAYASQGTDKVVINPHAVTGRLFELSEGRGLMPTYQSDPLMHVLAHEVGHHVDFQHAHMKDPESSGRARTENAFWRKSKGDQSAYGASDPAEGYAEAFALWLMRDRLPEDERSAALQTLLALYAERYGWESAS